MLQRPCWPREVSPGFRSRRSAGRLNGWATWPTPSSSSESQPAPRVRVTARRVDGAAQVQVEDNAGGPPPGFEAGLFQPFVTTKPKGIGLGPVSYTHLRAHETGRNLVCR